MKTTKLKMVFEYLKKKKRDRSEIFNLNLLGLNKSVYLFYANYNCKIFNVSDCDIRINNYNNVLLDKEEKDKLNFHTRLKQNLNF